MCVFSSHPFWTSSSLDVPAGVTQEEGHTGFLIHLPSAVRALIFVARRIIQVAILLFLYALELIAIIIVYGVTGIRPELQRKQYSSGWGGDCTEPLALVLPGGINVCTRVFSLNHAQPHPRLLIRHHCSNWSAGQENIRNIYE